MNQKHREEFLLWQKFPVIVRNELKTLETLLPMETTTWVVWRPLSQDPPTYGDNHLGGVEAAVSRPSYLWRPTPGWCGGRCLKTLLPVETNTWLVWRPLSQDPPTCGVQHLVGVEAAVSRLSYLWSPPPGWCEGCCLKTLLPVETNTWVVWRPLSQDLPTCGDHHLLSVGLGDTWCNG